MSYSLEQQLREENKILLIVKLKLPYTKRYSFLTMTITVLFVKIWSNPYAVRSISGFTLSGVNFINILRTNFLHERRFSSYILALSKNLYKKFARLTLMKLTAAHPFWVFNNQQCLIINPKYRSWEWNDLSKTMGSISTQMLITLLVISNQEWGKDFDI